MNLNPLGPVRVAVVEDHPAVQDSLAALIGLAPNLELVGRCLSRDQALASLPGLRPDVVLLDLHLGQESGLDLLAELRPRLPGTEFLVLTIDESSRRVYEALELGANGYLLKGENPARVLEAIQDVSRGGSPMSHGVARMVVERFRTPTLGGQPTVNQNQLSPREEQILRLAANGSRAKEIADDLGISIHTVQTHFRKIYDKLHVRSAAAAVARLRSSPSDALAKAG